MKEREGGEEHLRREKESRRKVLCNPGSLKI